MHWIGFWWKITSSKIKNKRFMESDLADKITTKTATSTELHIDSTFSTWVVWFFLCGWLCLGALCSFALWNPTKSRTANVKSISCSAIEKMTSKIAFKPCTRSSSKTDKSSNEPRKKAKMKKVPPAPAFFVDVCKFFT